MVASRFLAARRAVFPTRQLVVKLDCSFWLTPRKTHQFASNWRCNSSVAAQYSEHISSSSNGKTSDEVFSSVSVPFSLAQEGRATLTAHVSQNKTRLQISHKSPCRWIPMPSSSFNSASAMVALGHYGGGMADGDSATVEITVKDHAFLRVSTQGTNRVYKKRNNSNTGQQHPETMPTRVETRVQCGAHAKCWMTPDPTQLQRNARFHQETTYELEETSSLIAVDWITAGRLTAGERWDHDLCRLRTTVVVNGCRRFIDAQDLPPRFYGMDWNGAQLQTFGTVVLYNVERDVLARFRQLQRDLCQQHTTVRTVPDGTSVASMPFGASLSGRVLLGMNCGEESDVHVVRFAAESNEDVFRILHWAIGKEHRAYEERIRAVQSALPVHIITTNSRSDETEKVRELAQFSASSGMLVMADSMFPIGSFAHSFGLESCAQLGLIHSKKQVVHYLQSAFLSIVQQAIPLIRVCIKNPSQWNEVNQHADCLMSSNPPAHRASVEQAKNLRRIMEAVGSGRTIDTSELDAPVIHFAPLWSRVATETFNLGEMEACHAFSYTVARDLVSAAVRMNLLGPMEGQAVLWKELLPLLNEFRCMDLLKASTLDDAATCSPALEAIQPCHDLLSTRLFRS